MYFITDWTRRVDFDRMRRERLERARAEIGAAGLDAVVCLRVENVRYLTGLRPGWYPYSQFRYAAVMVGKEDPVCLVDSEDWAHRATTMYWLDRGRVKELNQIIPGKGMQPGLETMVRELREQGFSGGRLGIDILNVEILDCLKKAFPQAELVDGDECIKRARFIKTEDEIALMRFSSGIIDQGMTAALRAIRVGVRECELLGVVTDTFCSKGMEIAQCQSIVASGEENLYPLARFAPDRIVRHGDLVFIDTGGCFAGMYTEATRTAICGSPNEMQKRIYKTIHQAMAIIERELGPGVKSSVLVDAVADLYRDAGFEDYAHLTLLGHGIGVGGSEPPNLSKDARLTGAEFEFKPGMVFSFEPTLAVPGVSGGGTVRIEDEFLVTPTGCERLTLAGYDDLLLS